MKLSTNTKWFSINVMAAAVLLTSGSAALAADSKVGVKGAIPSYPDCSAMTGTAKLDCESAQMSKTATSGATTPAAKLPATGTAPKYPKQLSADGGATVPNTKKALQGTAPQYPAKNDANGKPLEPGAVAVGQSSTGSVSVKGTAPKYPGKASTSEEGAAIADKKASGVRTAGVAPKYPAAKAVNTKGAEVSDQKIETGVRSTGVAPKFPPAK